MLKGLPLQLITVVESNKTEYNLVVNFAMIKAEQYSFQSIGDQKLCIHGGLFSSMVLFLHGFRKSAMHTVKVALT